MKISKNRLKEIVRETITEDNEYQDFFKRALEKAGKSIPAMGEEEKKSFFDKIDAAWNGKGEKKELDEAELSLKSNPKLYKKIEDKLKRQKYNRTAEHHLTLLKSMNPKKLSRSDLDTLEDFDDLYETSLKESINEEKPKVGRKSFYTMDNIGSTKYSINPYDGKATHKDGSPFYGIQTFKNKKTYEKAKADLIKQGYIEESVNESPTPRGFTPIKYWSQLPSASSIKINVGSNDKPKYVQAKVWQHQSSHVILSYGNSKTRRVDKTQGLTNIFIKESVNEATSYTPKQVQRGVDKMKTKLISVWKRKGGYENFGDKEERILKKSFQYNPYGDGADRQIAKIIDNFGDWVMNYDGANESINESKSLSTKEIKKLNGKEVTSDQMYAIRHNADTKKVSMLGSTNDNGKTKHSVIFNDKTDITVFA